MGKTSKNIVQMSDLAIVRQVGSYLRHTRLQKNVTQTQLAEMAGLNRWTISQIEKGESITLTSLIQILRALDVLHVLGQFEISDEISPLDYAKMKRKEKKRARNKQTNIPKKDDLGW